MTERVMLLKLLNHDDPLFRLADMIDWSDLTKHLGKMYSDGPGRPETSIRLIVGLHYLKYLEDKSDEEIVNGFVHNPYWQYFCGLIYFEHHIPVHPTTLVKWRKKTDIAKIEEILKETIKTAKKQKFINNTELKRVNIDTTVQEKAITFPTDAKNYHKMRRILVKLAKRCDINLRQTYERVGQKALMMQSRYSLCRRIRKSKAQIRKLKIFLGRVMRDIERKCANPSDKLANFLNIAKKIILQKKNDTYKIYSIHAPEVECIAKGKPHKKYEFGCKVALATTSRNNWIVGMNAVHDNPYDGHTLTLSIDQVERLTEQRPEQAFVDRGYRGQTNYQDRVNVFITGKKAPTTTIKKFLKRRAAIEPIIGHVKNDHRLGRNFLAGKLGDKINAILSGAGFNLRKILNLITPKILKPLAGGT